MFREVRRVLHPTGTCWINIGDSYNSATQMNGQSLNNRYDAGDRDSGEWAGHRPMIKGLKPKDLIGIPWMLAFALRADGWYLRSEIIWHKRAPMPESVTDRPTKAHEQLFLLAKSPHYYYDNVAIMEPAQYGEEHAQKATSWGTNRKHPNKANVADYAFAGDNHTTSRMVDGSYGRNKRSVWTLGPEQFPGSHFATMPTKLVEPCILAGTSAYGACAKCGAPWARVVEREGETTTEKRKRLDYSEKRGAGGEKVRQNLDYAGGHGSNTRPVTTLGWQPTCECNCADVVPCTVLDPFSGAATTGLVALKHHRRYIGLELNPEYIELSHQRLARCQPMLLEVTG